MSWGDLLVKYNSSEENICYDEIGNPINYYNEFSFSWSDGRHLADAYNGIYSLEFTYNDEGIRTSKYVYNYKTGDESTHYYTLDGMRILTEQWDDKFIAYIYDENGAPIGMQYRTSSYAEDVFDYFYFEKNLQGDIVSVYNASGTKLVTYKYDAWGNHTTYTHTANIGGAQYNPFRYRGYYYDTELGLYYLNSRYYDSNTGRFISPDRIDVLGVTPDQLTDKNLYAYCDNNPITREDGDGEFWNYIIGGIVGAIFGMISVACTDDTDGWDVLVGGIAGAAAGVVAASGLGWVAQAGISAAIGVAAEFTNQTIDIAQGKEDQYYGGKIIIEGLYGGLTSALGSGLGHVVGKYVTKTKGLADAALDALKLKKAAFKVRFEAGKSSSALLRQARRCLEEYIFWENVGRGVSSSVGTVFVSTPLIPAKNAIVDIWW